jgi:flagellar protein FlaG
VAPTGNSASSAGEDWPAARAAAAAAAAADLDHSVVRLNESMAAAQRNLSFRVDKGTGRTVITVVDAATKEVVRQIPAEEVLALAQALEAGSTLLDARA